MSPFPVCFALLLAVLIPAAHAVDVTRNPALVAQLKTAATQLDRLALLPNDSDWLFDFTAQDDYTFAPGGVTNANAATFPATVGNGMTMAMLNLGPCAMLPPHYHPRASNYVVAVKGTTRTYMIEENGARVVQQTLTPGQMTIFPQGSMHTMYNMGCENAQLVSALSSEDQGTVNILNNLFNIPDADLINAAFGNQGFDANDTASGIPSIGTGSDNGPESCRAKCAAQTNGTS